MVWKPARLLIFLNMVLHDPVCMMLLHPAGIY